MYLYTLDSEQNKEYDVTILWFFFFNLCTRFWVEVVLGFLSSTMVSERKLYIVGVFRRSSLKISIVENLHGKNRQNTGQIYGKMIMFLIFFL